MFTKTHDFFSWLVRWIWNYHMGMRASMQHYWYRNAVLLSRQYFWHSLSFMAKQVWVQVHENSSYRWCRLGKCIGSAITTSTVKTYVLVYYLRVCTTYINHYRIRMCDNIFRASMQSRHFFNSLVVNCRSSLAFPNVHRYN